MKKYLYIFEDGELRQADEGPTDEDFAMIRDGYLEVICLDDRTGRFTSIDEDGGHTDITDASEEDGYHTY